MTHQKKHRSRDEDLLLNVLAQIAQRAQQEAQASDDGSEPNSESA
jgi:hypothetical protein